MTIIEITLIIIIFLLLLRIFIYDTNKRRILKFVIKDLKELEETQNKCSPSTNFTKTYNHREGQIYQIKLFINKIKSI